MSRNSVLQNEIYCENYYEMVLRYKDHQQNNNNIHISGKVGWQGVRVSELHASRS